MSDSLVIGVDIGTQGTKAALFDAAGRVLARAMQPSRLRQPAPGVVEEDPERQVDSVCNTIRQCVRLARVSAGSVAAIGIAGQMAGIIGIDKSGLAITPYDSWLDRRCAEQMRRMNDAAGDEVLRKAGCAPSFNHGPKILWWMHERPRAFRRIRSFVQPGGYAAMRLCGLSAAGAFIDTTYLHFSGFADNARRRWDEGLCRAFGLDRSLLPRIVEPTEIIGEIAPAMARRCGLRGAVCVVAGCGDTAASFLSCGATREGICVDVAGTASVFAATTTSFRADRKHRVIGCGRSATPGLWHPCAYVNGGGMNLEWFRKRVSKTSFETLNRQAGALPWREDDPLFVPHMEGRSCPGQPALRGAWVNLSWTHTRAHLYRAILESVALEYGLYRDIVLKLNRDLRIREIRITGGGEKSGLWNHIKATVLDAPLVRIAGGEGTPMGAAIVAAVGVGLAASVRAAADVRVRTGRRTVGDKSARAFARRRLDRYRRLIDLLADGI